MTKLAILFSIQICKLLVKGIYYKYTCILTEFVFFQLRKRITFNMYITMLGHIASSVAYYCWNITHFDILFKANFIKTYVGHVTN